MAGIGSSPPNLGPISESPQKQATNVANNQNDGVGRSRRFTSFPIMQRFEGEEQACPPHQFEVQVALLGASFNHDRWRFPGNDLFQE